MAIMWESADHESCPAVHERGCLEQQGYSDGHHVQRAGAKCLHDHKRVDLVAGDHAAEEQAERQHRYHNAIMNRYDVLRVDSDTGITSHVFGS